MGPSAGSTASMRDAHWCFHWKRNKCGLHKENSSTTTKTNRGQSHSGAASPVDDSWRVLIPSRSILVRLDFRSKRAMASNGCGRYSDRSWHVLNMDPMLYLPDRCLSAHCEQRYSYQQSVTESVWSWFSAIHSSNVRSIRIRVGYEFIGVSGCGHDPCTYSVLLVWTEDQVVVQVCCQGGMKYRRLSEESPTAIEPLQL